MTLPRLDLTLTPQPNGMGVEYIVESPNVPGGTSLFRLPRTVAGIPGSAVSAIDVRDGAGPLEVTEEDLPATATATSRSWSATRATDGDLRVSYFALAREVDEATRNGPLFDLRAEAGGLHGAGVTFLALPSTKTAYDVTIDWRLEHGRGISSFGEGQVKTTATVENLCFSYFISGPVHSYPPGDNPFTTYWLSDPPFDVADVASRSEKIYEAMREFFREPNPGHRILIRRHPYNGNGGTALYRSFMFGYSANEPPEVEDLTALIAHETAHNWPKIDGEHWETAWYTEGTAEYYSTILPHRAGLIDDDRYLTAMNNHAASYYQNPLQSLSNEQAGERFWADQRAQRVPYARGLFYFIDLNAKLLAHTGGQRSVDDLVLHVLERKRAGEAFGVGDWVDLVRRELGDAAVEDFAAMAAAKTIVPPSDALGPRYTLEAFPSRLVELGFAISSLETRVVTDLVPGSQADQAGVRNGDRIVDAPGGHAVARSRLHDVQLTLERGSETVRVTYAPEGDEVVAYRWILNDQ